MYKCFCRIRRQSSSIGIRNIFVVKIYVAAEIVERHAVQHAVRQIDLLVAFLADGHALDLGRQQAGRRVAADGAGLLIIAE